jgi:hypothetical protein
MQEMKTNNKSHDDEFRPMVMSLQNEFESKERIAAG